MALESSSSHQTHDDHAPCEGENVSEFIAHQSFIGNSLMQVIRFYQKYVSVLLPPSCRFYPSCSEYARQAIAKHGALKGGWLGTKRILRCQPFFKGGYDPVP